MISFYWPWIFLILPCPFFLKFVLPPFIETKQTALKVPFFEDIAAKIPEKAVKTPLVDFWFTMIIWGILVGAAARPQWIGNPIEQTINARDLMIAVDLSGSMREKDFIINNQPVNRLSATKEVASKFIRKRKGDRLGLILFGTHAYLQVPFTFDRETVVKLLKESFIGITDDRPATSMGDAIGLAVKKLSQTSNSRVLILLTDGANTAGEISPIKAAKLAKEAQLKIYTIGVGADEMLIKSFFGTRKINPSMELDEKTLKEIAEITGGHYFRARDTKALENIYNLLDELEPVEKDTHYFRPKKELYMWPLSVSLVFAFIFFGRHFYAPIFTH
jgi:Ca-activated chloride channel family protein